MTPRRTYGVTHLGPSGARRATPPARRPSVRLTGVQPVQRAIVFLAPLSSSPGQYRCGDVAARSATARALGAHSQEIGAGSQDVPTGTPGTCGHR
jgi:hypothetical protein